MFNKNFLLAIVAAALAISFVDAHWLSERTVLWLPGVSETRDFVTNLNNELARQIPLKEDEYAFLDEAPEAFFRYVFGRDGNGLVEKRITGKHFNEWYKEYREQQRQLYLEAIARQRSEEHKREMAEEAQKRRINRFGY